MIEFDSKKAEREKLHGLDRVEFNGKGFVVAMRKVAIDICATRGTVTSDDLRKFADANNIVPHHPGAWGAIFRPKYFKQVGFMKSEVVSSHGRPIGVWKYQQ